MKNGTIKRKTAHISFAHVALAALLMTFIGGCGGSKQPEKTEEPAPTIEFVTPAAVESEPETSSNTEPSEEAATATETGRKDGERFEATIMLEGMEETVRYEHVKDFAIGFEMDYEYESLTRQKESDRERFVSVYDDPKDPWNYLEVAYMAKTVDDAVSSVSAELSKEYDLFTEEGALDKAGSVTMIVTTNALGGAQNPNFLQTVYILPAGDGSIVAAAHYTTESAEGFGSRFDQMMNTLNVIGRTAESNLSNELALEAVRKYCIANNPDLEKMIGSDDYTLYWDASLNDKGEIVVLYRSYTGALIRYYVDPDSGQTYVTEQVPGIIEEEQRTDESFNAREYLD